MFVFAKGLKLIFEGNFIEENMIATEQSCKFQVSPSEDKHGLFYFPRTKESFVFFTKVPFKKNKLLFLGM